MPRPAAGGCMQPHIGNVSPHTSTTAPTVPMKFVIAALVIAASSVAAQSLPPTSRTVYRCEDGNKVLSSERFNRTVRYEWLSQYHWSDLEEVRLYATDWMWMYNNERPNMALGGITPKQRLAMAA